MAVYWAPAVLWLAIIVWESAALSSSETGRFLVPLLHALFPHATAQQLDFVHGLLRKAGHFFGYAVLSFFLYRGWWATLVNRAAGPRNLPDLRWRTMRSMFVGKASVLALFCTTLVAALDELHQSTQLSRTGTPRDVLLDSAGAWFAQMLILVTASHWMRLITARAKNLEEHREPILRP